MKKIIAISALWAIMLMSFSCKKAPSLTVSPATCEVTSDGGTVQLTVNANYPWSAESDADWVRVVTKSGAAEDSAGISEEETARIINDDINKNEVIGDIIDLFGIEPVMED